MSCLEERTGLLCSRLTVQGPVQPQGEPSWGSRVQSHLPCVARGLVIHPDRVDSVRLATLLAVSHVCQGKVYINSHIRNRPTFYCSQKCLRWHQRSSIVGAASLFYFRDCLAAPEGGKCEFLSPIYQTFIIVCLQTECQRIKCTRLPLSYLCCWGNLASFAVVVLSM